MFSWWNNIKVTFKNKKCPYKVKNEGSPISLSVGVRSYLLWLSCPFLSIMYADCLFIIPQSIVVSIALCNGNTLTSTLRDWYAFDFTCEVNIMWCAVAIFNQEVPFIGKLISNYLWRLTLTRGFQFTSDFTCEV